MKLLKISFAMLSTAALCTTVQAKNINACVFDIMGKGGPAYSSMIDYKIAAKKWGVNLKLIVEKNESTIESLFIQNKCDLVAMSGMRGRKYNKFVGSVDAIGAAASKKVVNNVMKKLANPKLASRMKQGPHEVAGVIPLGAAYIFVRDRKINTLAKAKGKKIAVLTHDKSQAKMVSKVGLSPVNSNILNIGTMFNNGQVDIVALPAMAYGGLEVEKGICSKFKGHGKKKKCAKMTGGVINFPITQVTGNIIIRHKKFPAGYGQKSRTWIAKQRAKAFKQIKKDERGIPQKYWINLTKAEKLEYTKMMREARMSMTKEGVYDKTMMRLLKKVRCAQNRASFECALSGE